MVCRLWHVQLAFLLLFAVTFPRTQHAADTGSKQIPLTETSRLENAWWQDPVLKFKVDTGTKLVSGGPQCMNKDEQESYLFLSCGWAPSEGAVLYDMRNLMQAGLATNVVAVAKAAPADYYGKDCWADGWKGCALSAKLGRIVTGTHGANRNTSLPLTNVWVKDITVFTLTNNRASARISTMAFSSDSSRLYSSTHRSGWDDRSGSERAVIHEWKVRDLAKNGEGFFFVKSHATSVSTIQNLSAYSIGGRDLLYYGEGAGDVRVCVYDPSVGKETVLVTRDSLYGEPAVNVINVKIGGVGLGKMHIYVQCDSGSLRIYDLAENGKSIGECVQSFTAGEMQVILGVPEWPRLRAFEVSNDERLAFFSPSPRATWDGNMKLFVVWRKPGT